MASCASSLNQGVACMALHRHWADNQMQFAATPCAGHFVPKLQEEVRAADTKQQCVLKTNGRYSMHLCARFCAGLLQAAAHFRQ